jgi:hypothetical protein
MSARGVGLFSDFHGTKGAMVEAATVPAFPRLPGSLVLIGALLRYTIDGVPYYGYREEELFTDINGRGLYILWNRSRVAPARLKGYQGHLTSIAYRARRDGSTKNYEHTFEKPPVIRENKGFLCISRGSYRFTERGIIG